MGESWKKLFHTCHAIWIHTLMQKLKRFGSILMITFQGKVKLQCDNYFNDKDVHRFFCDEHFTYV